MLLPAVSVAPVSLAFAAPPGAEISNQARLEFTASDGSTDQRLSNTVTLTAAVVRSPSTVELTRVVTSGNGSYNEPVGPSACLASGSFAVLDAPVLIGGTPIDPATPQQLNVSPVYNAGEAVFVRLTDSDQNLDFRQAEYAVVVLRSTATGDSETLRLTETGEDTGVFAGYLSSSSAAANSGDCVLQAASNTDISVSYTDPVDSADTAASQAVIDPTQRVFETQTGTAVSGSLVELLDADTGQPATVYGNDGISQFPSAITSGGSVTDSGGTVYVFAPGEYRFPVVPDGDYRLRVTPPPEFAAPSQRSAAEIQSLPGAPYELAPASFGNRFTKNGGLSFAIDLPVDPNASDLFLDKRSRTATAAIGDFIQFELALQNSGSSGLASQLEVHDRLPTGMRYVAGSTRLNGDVAADPVRDASNRLTFSLPSLAAGERLTVSYVVELVSAKRGDTLTNRAQAVAAGGLLSNQADAAIRVTEDLFRSTGTLMGRVLEADCAAETFDEEAGVAGIRVYLEDGRYAVTDAGGRFHFEGLDAGNHVLQLDRFTVPDYFDVVGCSDNANEAGNPDSQFVKLGRGALLRQNFYLVRKPAPEGRVELELRASGGDTAEAVRYALDIEGIGNVAISNIDLMVLLPKGVSYTPGSLTIDGQRLGEPRVRGPSISMALPDRRGNWTGHIEFEASIADDTNGELATRAIATFDTPMESGQKTPVAETRMLREPATVQNAGYVLDLKFDVLSAELSADDRRRLDELLDDWQGVRDVRITAVGHSDSTRISARSRNLFPDNYALSRARARSAADYLAAALGVAAADVLVDGRGPDDPVASNATAEGRQQNRRVELILSGLRPSRPSFLEVTRASSGTQQANTRGAIPGTGRGPDARFVVDPDAGTPRAQTLFDVETLSPGLGILHPAERFLPAIPATRVSIQHRPGQTVQLTINGEPVSQLSFEATVVNRARTVAVSRWRTARLEEGENRLRARILDANGVAVDTLESVVHFTGPPARARVLEERSHFVADGKSRPVIALQLFDRSGRPARPGMTGNFLVRAPYRSWFDVEDERENDLVRLSDRQSHYRIGDNGLAFIELEPTTRSGEVIVDLEFANQRSQEIRGWLKPAARDWILVGFAEGSAAYNTLSNNMTAAAEAGFEDGYAEEGRIAFFAKGQIRGDYLLTIAYDSDRQRDRSALETVVDPNAYYPLYADTSEQRFEAASQRKLFLRLEREQFVALFGDMDTGLSVTELSRYERRMNGLKAEYRGEHIGYTAFAADTEQAFVRDELRGDGTSGLYRLSRTPIIVNSEKIRIETRDRFDSGQILDVRTLSRFVDYTLDPLRGTVYFKRPVRSRDENFNPIYIVAEYEALNDGGEEMLAGGRVSLRNADDTLEVGTTVVRDDTTGSESSLRGVDLRWQMSEQTLLRAEYANTEATVSGVSQRGNAQKIEIEHASERARVRAFIREVDDGFGLGYQAAADRGVRRLGVEGEGRLSERLLLQGEAAWQQQLASEDIRNLARATLRYEQGAFNASVGFLHASDKFEDGETRSSDLAEFGIARRVFSDRVLLRASSISALGGGAANADFPDSLVVGTDIRINDRVELIAEYERADGEALDAQMTRLGVRATPWKRATLASSVTSESNEFGPRLFANVGLVQAFTLGEHWSFDVGVDQSNTLRQPGLRPIDADRTLASGSLSDDFLAGYAGALYSAELWSANLRLEHRNSDTEERQSLLLGWYREPQKGHGLSAGLTIFDAESMTGGAVREADLKFGWAYRLADSRWAFLDRADLVYRDDQQPLARQLSWRFINNFNASRKFGERGQLSLQYAFKYVRSEFGTDAYTGYTDLVGVDLRRSLNGRWDIGASASVLSAYRADTRDFGVGFDVGYNLGRNLWLSVGYNLAGFDDEDFRDARYSAQGPFIRIALKADQGLLSAIANRR